MHLACLGDEVWIPPLKEDDAERSQKLWCQHAKIIHIGASREWQSRQQQQIDLSKVACSLYAISSNTVTSPTLNELRSVRHAPHRQPLGSRDWNPEL
jgi:hypothetical protein